MKDRIHEIGIFLSIAIKKTAIIGQHILENLMVAVIAFVLAFVISICAANQVGKVIDRSDSENTEIVEVTGISAKETLRLILVLVSLSFLKSWESKLLSTGISSIVILRIHPRNILTSMS